MKKILVVLSCVAMMFASCGMDNGSPVGPKFPKFPELQEFIVESGAIQEVTFSVDKPWMISLPDESADYASITYDGITDTQFYGEAGEHTITVIMEEGLSSYAKDYVVNIEMTLEDITRKIAVLTVPRIPYVITVTGTKLDGNATFEQGGHPANGPFASSPNTYKVTYKDEYDGPEAAMIVEHSFDKLYNYKLYALSRDAEGKISFGPISAEDGYFPWVRLTTFGTKGEKFRLTMEYTSEDAVMTGGVGFEAYVNIEDENGDAIVSVYYLYNPNETTESAPAVTLAYPTDATINGVTFSGSGNSYIMTIKNADLLGAKEKSTALKIQGYQGGGFAQNNLAFTYNETDDVYYMSLAPGANPSELLRENTLSIGTLTDSYKEYTITVVLDWIPASETENDGGVEVSK